LVELFIVVSEIQLIAIGKENRLGLLEFGFCAEFYSDNRVVFFM